MKSYDRIGLYHDAHDPRIIVRKRVPGLGWTINVGHRKGRILLAGVGMTILVIASLVLAVLPLR